MIVAYNALSVRPGVTDGGATYSLNLLRHLPAALPEAEILVFARDGEERFDRETLRVRSLPTPGGALGRVGVESLLLGRELRRAGAGVLVNPNESVPIAPPCPVVVIAQNLVYHRDDDRAFTGRTRHERAASAVQAAYYRRRMRSAYRRAAWVVAVSEETCRVLSVRAGLDRAKAVVVHEGSDSFLLPAPRTRARVSRLLVVGALAPYKNLLATIDLFARLHRRSPGIRLEIVGGDWRGYRAILDRAVREAGVAEATTFAGDIATDELARLYDTSVILLALSSCESFGLPVVEAMRHGLPVVAADRSSLPEVVGDAALLVDPADAEGAAAAVQGLLDAPGRLESFAAAGRARAAELSWARTAAGVASVIRAAVSHRAR